MKKSNISVRRVSAGISIIAIVFTIAVIGQIMMIVNRYEAGAPSGTFYEGTTISHVNIGGLSKQQAEYVVGTRLRQKINDMNLSIFYEDKEWQFRGGDFEVQANVKQVIEDAYKYQQKMTSQAQQLNFEANSVVGNGMNLDIAFAFLFPDINKKIDEIVLQIEREPIDAKVVFQPDKEPKFSYTSAKSGVKVDQVKLFKDLEKQFDQNHAEMKVYISTVTVEASVTEALLKDRTALISTFSTDLHNSKPRRIHNVALALSKFHGLEIAPGEEVSFNALTSPQTLEGGYEKSIIIFNGQFVEGVGGGLCQVSTTMYNALILADLEIVEVNKHTLPVGYIELAFDAMVSENWSDLRFKNNSTNNVYIAAYLKEERAYVEIYGKTLENGMKLKRRVEFIRTIPHPGDRLQYDTENEFSTKVLYKGEKYRLAYPREGYEAKGYIQYYSGGNLVKEVLIRHDIYEPQHGIIIEGATEPPKDYTIPPSEVEWIAPQQVTSNTTGSNVSAVLLKNNPAQYNP